MPLKVTHCAAQMMPEPLPPRPTLFTLWVLGRLEEYYSKADLAGPLFRHVFGILDRRLDSKEEGEEDSILERMELLSTLAATPDSELLYFLSNESPFFWQLPKFDLLFRLTYPFVPEEGSGKRNIISLRIPISLFKWANETAGSFGLTLVSFVVRCVVDLLGEMERKPDVIKWKEEMIAQAQVEFESEEKSGTTVGFSAELTQRIALVSTRISLEGIESEKKPIKNPSVSLVQTALTRARSLLGEVSKKK